MRIGRLGVGSALIGGVLGVAAMVGIGVGIANTDAFAQTPSPTPGATARAEIHADYLAKLAANLGITVDALKAANLKTQNELVDQALAAGRITAEQAAQAKTRLAESGGAHLGAHFKHHRGGPAGLRFPVLRGTLDAVAAYIGIDAATLKTELGTGKSLAQIATERGKTRDGLKAAITQDLQGRLASTEFNTMLDRIIDASHMPGSDEVRRGTATP
jgi:hypothetical protein